MFFFRKRIRKTIKKNARPFCSAVVAAGGASLRMGGVNKLFEPMLGEPVLVHTIRVLEDSPEIDEIVVSAREEDIVPISGFCKEYGFEKVTKIVRGGDTRCKSVYNGALAVSEMAELIAVHDGARPLVTEDIIRRVVRAAASSKAAAPAIPVSDTVKIVRRGAVVTTPDRSELYAVQTPQVFAAVLLKGALANALEKNLCITDDCMAAEALGIAVTVTEGSPENLKITTPPDLVAAEAILRERSETK